ncbi:helix-turn-helix domain-containing protein [Blautia producta]|uniref:helix-turn-helix domain-containing protein n=1 Tax=Blautia TaxID=572511 RepID=UPI0004984668|nr:helix-turn-helix domain-containing protein [Blautia sp.]
MEKLVYSIPEAAQLLGISKSYAYELVKLRRLPIIDFGKRKVIPKTSLETWIQKNTEVPTK